MICIAHPIFCGDKIEKNEMGGACSAYGEGFWWGSPKGRRPLGRPRRRRENNIKMNLQKWDV